MHLTCTKQSLTNCQEKLVDPAWISVRSKLSTSLLWGRFWCSFFNHKNRRIGRLWQLCRKEVENKSTYRFLAWPVAMDENEQVRGLSVPNPYHCATDASSLDGDIWSTLHPPANMIQKRKTTKINHHRTKGSFTSFQMFHTHTQDVLIETPAARWIWAFEQLLQRLESDHMVSLITPATASRHELGEESSTTSDFRCCQTDVQCHSATVPQCQIPRGGEAEAPQVLCKFLGELKWKGSGGANNERKGPRKGPRRIRIMREISHTLETLERLFPWFAVDKICSTSSGQLMQQTWEMRQMPHLLHSKSTPAWLGAHPSKQHPKRFISLNLLTPQPSLYSMTRRTQARERHEWLKRNALGKVRWDSCTSLPESMAIQLPPNDSANGPPAMLGKYIELPQPPNSLKFHHLQHI